MLVSKVDRCVGATTRLCSLEANRTYTSPSPSCILMNFPLQTSLSGINKLHQFVIMSGWERLRGNANALFSDLSTGNLVDQGGNHGWADILFFVFAPYVIIPLLLPLDVFISKAGHEWLHGRWEDSHTHSKLVNTTVVVFTLLIKLTNLV